MPNPFHPALPDMVITSLDENGFSIQSSGKGFRAEDRLLSAYGEIIERFLMFKRGPDLVTSYTGQKDVLSPELFCPEFPVDRQVVEWIKVKRADGPRKSYFVHRPIRHSLMPKFYRHNSNGCAVGKGSVDATARARSEILERHNFLSAWYFQNLCIAESDSFLVEELLILEQGWEVFKFHIKSQQNKGTSCVVLVNREDPRFELGGGILGLAYGKSAKAEKSALSECLQALEVLLLTGSVDKSLAFYLKRQDGGQLLLDFLLTPRLRQSELVLGKEYCALKQTNFPIPWYAEYFIENSLPHQLDQSTRARLPESERFKIIDRKGIPVPIG